MAIYYLYFLALRTFIINLHTDQPETTEEVIAMNIVHRPLKNENIYAIYVKKEDTLIINTIWNGINDKIYYIEY